MKPAPQRASENQAIKARRREVERYLCSGIHSQRVIAEALGVCKTTVQRDILAIEAEWAEGAGLKGDNRTAWRLRCHSALEAMESNIGPDSVNPELPLSDRIRAIRTRLEIVDRRAKLEGLYVTVQENQGTDHRQSPFEVFLRLQTNGEDPDSTNQT